MQDTHLVWLQMQMSWSILHTLIISKTGNSPKWNWNEVWLVCERFFFIFIPDKNRQKQFILQLFLLIVISGRYIYYYFWSKNVWCTKTISNTHTLKPFLGSVVSCFLEIVFTAYIPHISGWNLSIFTPIIQCKSHTATYKGWNM